jgi:hypothetical protein
MRNRHLLAVATAGLMLAGGAAFAQSGQGGYTGRNPSPAPSTGTQSPMMNPGSGQGGYTGQNPGSGTTSSGSSGTTQGSGQGGYLGQNPGNNPAYTGQQQPPYGSQTPPPRR